jgi:hypothetical protein
MSKHIDSGFRCLVSHLGDDGKVLPPCVLCKICKKWIRPEEMEEECISNSKNS